MCEVCSIEGKNYKFLTGNRPLRKNNLYRVYESSVATVFLCHTHDIELFMKGETRFLKSHLGYARILAKRSRYQDEIELPSLQAYGF